MSSSPATERTLVQLAREIARDYVLEKQKSRTNSSLTDEIVRSAERKFGSTLREEIARLETNAVVDTPTMEMFANLPNNRLNAGHMLEDPTLVSESEAAREIPLGSLPSEYELLGILGQGGMGVVYKARHRPLRRVVAIKMILAGAHASPEILRRFQQEAEASAQLSHPNIVSVYEVGQHHGLPYFSMEFIDGKSLSAHLRESSLTSHRAAELLLQMCAAVHYSHEQGILHRDLKPQNIMLTTEGIAKVADFGLAKRLSDDDPQYTRTGDILGTPGYMAPEQARGSREVGPTADVYALGAILYCMLTGRAPFVSPTTFETLRQIINQEPVAPSRLQPKIDRDLETICLKCLEKDPVKRYSSAEALSEELQKVLEGKPIKARPTTQLDRSWKWCKRNPGLATLYAIVSTLLACLLLGGLTAAVVINERKHAEQLAKEEALANAELAENQAHVAQDTTRAVLYQTREFFDERPELNPLREKVLDKILSEIHRVHDRFYGESTNDIFRASAISQLGMIYLEAERPEQALKMLLEAEQSLQQLDKLGTVSRADVSAMRLTFAIADAHRALHHFDDAERRYLQNLEQRQTYFEKNPQFNQSTQEQSLAEVYGRLGKLYLVMGKSRQAEDYIAKSVAARRTGLEQAPHSREAMGELAGTLTVLGQLYQRQGKLDLMRGAQNESLVLTMKLAESNKNSFTIYNLVLKQKQLAEQELTAGALVEAESLLIAAIKSLEKLRAEKFEAGNVLDQLAYCYYLRALLSRAQQRDSSDNFNTAIAFQKEIVQQSSTVDRQGLLLKLLSRGGPLEEALSLANKLASQEKSLMATGYATLGLGFISARLAEDPIRQQELQTKAIALAKRLIELGWDDIDALRSTDPDFAPLQRLPAFQQMLDAAGKPTQATIHRIDEPTTHSPSRAQRFLLARLALESR